MITGNINVKFYHLFNPIHFFAIFSTSSFDEAANSDAPC